MDENVIFTKKEPDAQPGDSQATPPSSPEGISNPYRSTPPPPPSSPPPSEPLGVIAGKTEIAPPSQPPPPKPKRTFSFGKKPFIIFGGIVLLLIVGLLVGNLLGLFGGRGEPEPVAITYWGLWEEPGVMQSVLADFKKEYPHINVEYSKKDIKQYRQSLMTQINNGSGPDVYRFHNSWTPLMQEVLLPLSSDVITPQEFQTTYFPIIQRDLIKNGAIYGIPLGIDTVALFVNTELFQAAGVPVPRTWNEFIDVSRELTVKDSDGKIQTAGAAMGTFDNITHAPDIISVLLAQNGTNFTEFESTLGNTAEALQFYTAFSKGEGGVWDDTLDPSRTAFAKGNLAMYFGYSWDIFTIQELNPQLSFTTHQVPSLPGRSMSVGSYWVDGVSNKTKHPDEVMLLMAYLAKKETAQKFYQEAAKVRLFGEPYARRDLAETLQSNPLIYPFVSQAETAVSTYFVSDTYDDGLNNPLNAYLGNAVRAMQGNSSGDTSVETLSEGVTQVLGRYGQ